MKGFIRSDLHFSLCGLNCDLCPMKLGNYCPGCGGGDGNQGCTIARCSLQHNNVEYCFQCDNFPCKKYDGIEEFDSFITHRHQLADMKRIREMGIGQYHHELKQKSGILTYLLENFNEGRKKSFFHIAVNLLDISDIKSVMEELNTAVQSPDLTLNEKSAIAANLFRSVADKRGITLKFNKKKANK